MKKLLHLATLQSKRGLATRRYHLAAIGIRSDGAIVCSSNGSSAHNRNPAIHAEARLARKLDVGATVIVVRTLRNGNLAMAKPCKHCLLALKHRGVSRIYYSTSNGLETITL